MGKLNQYSTVEERKEHFVNKLNSFGKFILVGEYFDSKVVTTFKCIRCGCEFNVSPSNAIIYKFCPNCRIDYFSKINDSVDIRKQNFINSLLKEDRFELVGEYITTQTKTKFRCKTCGFEFVTTPAIILKQKCCKKCEGKECYIARKNKNTISDTHPEVLHLLKNKDDAYRYSFGTIKKLEWICPDCGNTVTKKPMDAIKKHFICQYCGDGFSVPNKFFLNLLLQSNIKFKREKRFDWYNQKYLYDFYLPNYDMIIEVNGMQHYSSGFFGNLDFKQIITNDFNKKFFAVQHGITRYIELDFRYSDFDFMQNEVINSDISKLFDFNKIDMRVVCENTYKSMLNIVCDFYNVHGYISPDEIAKYFDISRPTIIKYLKLGEKFGICNYTVKLSHLEAAKKRGINRRKPVLQYTLDNEFIAEYSCCEEAGAVYNVGRTAISAAVRNKIKSSCGYIWKYKEGE